MSHLHFDELLLRLLSGMGLLAAFLGVGGVIWFRIPPRVLLIFASAAHIDGCSSAPTLLSHKVKVHFLPDRILIN